MTVFQDTTQLNTAATCGSSPAVSLRPPARLQQGSRDAPHRLSYATLVLPLWAFTSFTSEKKKSAGKSCVRNPVNGGELDWTRSSQPHPAPEATGRAEKTRTSQFIAENRAKWLSSQSAKKRLLKEAPAE